MVVCGPGRFRLTVSQGGKTVFDGVYGGRYGGRSQNVFLHHLHIYNGIRSL
jgi:hypothetical protein